MGFIQTLAEQAGGGVIGAGMGLLLQGQNDRRQIKQQQALTNIQSAAQKDLTDYNMSKQLQMWKDTSYGPQMEQLSKAGLNPGLIYGMGGGGGQSSNVNSGSVGSGSAPTGGREVQDMIGMGMQMQLLKAQKDNIEADTKMKLSQVPVNDATVPNKNADTAGKLVDNQMKQIDLKIKDLTQYDQATRITSESLKVVEELDQLYRQGKIQEQTFDAKINQVKAEAIGAVLKNKLTEEQTTAVVEGVKQGWKDLELKEWLNKQNVENKDQDQILGIIQSVLHIIGGKIPGIKQMQEVITNHSTGASSRTIYK